jgi:hypothetical protein
MEDESNEIMNEINEISLPSGSIRRGGGFGVGSIIAKCAPAAFRTIPGAIASAANIPTID